MEFFQPQIQLGRETVLDEPDLFYLHVVTLCPRTNFRPGSHQFDDSALANNMYKVILNLEQDTAMPDLAFDTPVAFTLELGSIAFPGEEGTITVEIRVPEMAATASAVRGDTDPPPPTTTGGSGTVSTSEAKDRPKPIPPITNFPSL